jgi:hypothetical protein
MDVSIRHYYAQSGYWAYPDFYPGTRALSKGIKGLDDEACRLSQYNADITVYFLFSTASTVPISSRTENWNGEQGKLKASARA